MAILQPKICVVSISLARGGAERSTAILTHMLTEEGFDVHLVLLTDAIDYEFKGQLFNLGREKSDEETPRKRFKRIQKLRKYLITEKFDYIIDNRSRQSAYVELLYLNYVYSGLKLIYVVRSHNIKNYLTRYNWLSKVIVKRVHKIIGVSKEITDTINSNFHTNKAITIYNPVDLFSKSVEVIDSPVKYILFLGRLDDDSKNFSLLIDAYAQSKLPENSVQLHIYGEGQDEDNIRQKIKAVGLKEAIKMFPFTSNVYPILKNALFLALTSHYEGFPRVLIEALSVGTPVISVNCKSGPSEIIQHERNGLLVENYNPTALSEAYNRFLFDHELYNFCKKNSKESVSHLNQPNIAKQWSNIFIK